MKQPTKIFSTLMRFIKYVLVHAPPFLHPLNPHCSSPGRCGTIIDTCRLKPKGARTRDRKQSSKQELVVHLFGSLLNVVSFTYVPTILIFLGFVIFVLDWALVVLIWGLCWFVCFDVYIC